MIASPCVRNCCLDQNDICLGCGRSLVQIKAWHGMDEKQKKQTLEQAQRRKNGR